MCGSGGCFRCQSGFRCLLPLLVRPWDLLPNLLRPSPLVSPTQQCVRTGQRRVGVSHGALGDQRARVCSACVKLASGSIAWRFGHDSLFAIIASRTKVAGRAQWRAAPAHTKICSGRLLFSSLERAGEGSFLGAGRDAAPPSLVVHLRAGTLVGGTSCPTTSGCRRVSARHKKKLQCQTQAYRHATPRRPTTRAYRRGCWIALQLRVAIRTDRNLILPRQKRK